MNKNEPTYSPPDIGVFWFYQGQVLGRAVTIAEGCEAVPGRVDTQLTHAQVWEEEGHFLRLFPELVGREYFDISRGRVLYQTANQQPLIYLDPGLRNAAIKKNIAEFFNFSPRKATWVSDIHYTTDPAELSRLFND